MFTSSFPIGTLADQPLITFKYRQKTPKREILILTHYCYPYTWYPLINLKFDLWNFIASHYSVEARLITTMSHALINLDMDHGINVNDFILKIDHFHYLDHFKHLHCSYLFVISHRLLLNFVNRELVFVLSQRWAANEMNLVHVAYGRSCNFQEDSIW